ncbi:MAG: 16S rRNA (cytidine(1402)-2'-O)-methyltransferase [Candidatus Melainabacteria bacterium]|nr:16S rRNA (cytidine(1402)-2'-O)-methyltransferase [Candidatus Melainabacteria bacterium]
MLYLVSTPIGNLGDFSFRAVEALKTCDYILCEDTRHSRTLLEHYGIKVHLKSFHKFNEAGEEERVIADLKEGKTLGLISDAGTPIVSDPGNELVARCRNEGIEVTAVPGACALINALILSGLPPTPFQFLGFLPKKEKELESVLGAALLYPGTSIAYESPHRIEETLQTLHKAAADRKLCVARELTKLHEECLNGKASELLEHFKKHPPRGEMVLLISPPAESVFYAELSLEELVAMLEKDLRLSKKDAIKMAAELRQLPKREVYKQFIRSPHNDDI